MQVAQGGYPYTVVRPDELRRRFELQEPFAVVDARSDENRRESGRTIPGAVRIPPAELENRLEDLPRGRTLLLLADLHEQAERAQQLVRHGVTDVWVIEGGFEAFARAGGDTVSIS
ncbi:MAG TPA: rhodanese-like domain-containing protein [Fredinandcohnia sp.]|nr:rhodanese-like domain-containing protein [Fredinandcohnia sp.]